MSEFSEIKITCGSKDEASKLGRLLVDRYLAACAQVSGPIESCYRWKGEVHVDEEWLLNVKTRSCLFDEVSELIRENHSYELPQIIAVPIGEMLFEYETWLGEQIH